MRSELVSSIKSFCVLPRAACDAAGRDLRKHCQVDAISLFINDRLWPEPQNQFCSISGQTNFAFSALQTVIKFYNARDVGGFDPTEVLENVNHEVPGNRRSSAHQNSNLVAVLRALSADYQVGNNEKQQ